MCHSDPPSAAPGAPASNPAKSNKSGKSAASKTKASGTAKAAESLREVTKEKETKADKGKSARKEIDEDSKRARDMNYDWVNEEDMEVFRKALVDEPHETLGNESPHPERIRSVSDFAPIQERVRSKGTKHRGDVIRESWFYAVSRWPLLALILSIVGFEFFLYLVVRQWVNLIEYFSSWSGARGKLRIELREAKSYDEWKTRALALDDHLGYSAWKQHPQNAYYDSSLIRRVLRSLKDLREKNDVEGVMSVLEVALRSNFAGVESYHLYSESYYGTKLLVEAYIDEVALSVEFVRKSPTSIEDKAKFFRHSAKNLGATALCLSGGASFGYYHFGVVRAMLDEDLLPRVITGTSAGAIIAAFTCTRTDDELKEMLVPALADNISACEESIATWMKRAYRTGARFDTVEWARKASFFTMGSMTFKEAFERTGKILNVSVIPYDTHSPTKLLNYLTAPDCVIYTAVIASAAVPGILNPVVLLTKGKDGRVKPWEFQGKHKDGSLRVDIPLESLHLLYNVNFAIASQVNPHISLFSFSSRGAPGRPVSHRGGKGWRGGYALSAAEKFLKLELEKNFRIMRELELLPMVAGQDWSAVFLQKYDGTVTIWPKTRVWDWVRILSDPDRVELERMINVGRAVTWPKLHMIDNRMRIERQIDLGREEVHCALASRSPTNLMHRESSYELGRRARGGMDADNGKPLVELPSSPFDQLRNYASDNGSDDAEYDDERDEEEIVADANGTDGHLTPTKRRRSILAKLGLRSNQSLSFDSTRSAPSSRSDDERHDESRFYPRGNSSGRRGHATSESHLRRKFSMGKLKLAERLRGARESSLGVGSDSEDEGLYDHTHEGSSSGASNR